MKSSKKQSFIEATNADRILFLLMIISYIIAAVLVNIIDNPYLTTNLFFLVILSISFVFFFFYIVLKGAHAFFALASLGFLFLLIYKVIQYFAQIYVTTGIFDNCSEAIINEYSTCF